MKKKDEKDKKEINKDSKEINKKLERNEKDAIKDDENEKEKKIDKDVNEDNERLTEKQSAVLQMVYYDEGQYRMVNWINNDVFHEPLKVFFENKDNKSDRKDENSESNKANVKSEDKDKNSKFNEKNIKTKKLEEYFEDSEIGSIICIGQNCSKLGRNILKSSSYTKKLLKIVSFYTKNCTKNLKEEIDQYIEKINNSISSVDKELCKPINELKSTINNAFDSVKGCLANFVDLKGNKIGSCKSKEPVIVTGLSQIIYLLSILDQEDQIYEIINSIYFLKKNPEDKNKTNKKMHLIKKIQSLIKILMEQKTNRGQGR